MRHPLFFILASTFGIAAKLSAAAPPDGFVSVFNGDDLTGWHGSPDFWSVEDGALTGVTDGSLKYNRFITWKGGTLKNFELRAKVKVTKGGNSGIQYRGKERPDLGEWVVTGYQCDVVAKNPNYNGMLYEERGRRILSHTGEKVVVDVDGQPWIVGEMPVKEFAPDEWHDFRIRVRGNHHEHWIDGHKTADLIDLDAHGRALEGVLAVQVHVGPAMTIQYKDIFLQPLADDLPLIAPDKANIPATARHVRPQGKLPKGWSAPVRGLQSIDLLEQFRRFKRTGPHPARKERITAGGRPLPAIFQHAAAPNQPPAEVITPAYRLPETGKGIEKIVLRTALGFKDGAAFVEARSDGCDFVILANDEEVFRKSYATQEWLPQEVDLTRFAGKDVSFRFRIHPRTQSAADWSSWGRPGIWVIGDENEIEKSLNSTTQAFPHWPIEQLHAEPPEPDHVFRSSESTRIAVMDGRLDLATATSRLASELSKTPVPLAPRIVAGEGEHPDNHTLVPHLFGKCGIFLASGHTSCIYNYNLCLPHP